MHSELEYELMKSRVGELQRAAATDRLARSVQAPATPKPVRAWNRLFRRLRAV